MVYFKDETMAAYEAMPLMNLNYVPQSMYALEAQKVDKFAASHILRAVDGSGNPVAAPALNPTQLTNLSTLQATPAANYVQTTSNGSVALPVVAGNPTSGLAAGQIWYDSGSNVMKYYDGAVKTFGTSSGGVTSVTAGNGLTGGTITASGTINVDVGVTTGKIVQVGASDKLPAIDGSNLTNITATDATKLPLAGGTMTGPLANNSNSASTALAVTQTGAGYAATFMGGNVGIGTASPVVALDLNSKTDSIRAPAGTTAQRPATPANGDLRYNSDLGTVEGYLSSMWTSLSTAIVGRATINASPYTITSAQGGVYFNYIYTGAGVVNLPTLSTLKDGWQVTVTRQVAKSVMITPNGADAFASGISTLEMQGNNIQSVTLTKQGSYWTITNKTMDCIVGQSCWGTGNIYIGTFNGSQYFTTPGNCVAGSPYTCDGAVDTQTRAWATTAPESNTLIGLSNYTDGRTQTAIQAGYATAQAAQFCNNINSTGG